MLEDEDEAKAFRKGEFASYLAKERAGDDGDVIDRAKHYAAV